jgi:hypothetical protein
MGSWLKVTRKDTNGGGWREDGRGSGVESNA